jgi:diguanylate cyclase (GGDEF)-like protein
MQAANRGRRMRLVAVDTQQEDATGELQALRAEVAALRARLIEAESLAERDPLTGALNRRGFMRALDAAISAVERYQTPAAVVFIDLDGFKAVNDSYGHAAGDAVLQHVARLLLAHVRESDCVGRLGGDEFGVVLARASAEEAARKGEALLHLIQTTPCVYAGVLHSVTASIGHRPIGAAQSAEHALAAADEAMYAEKRMRRMATAWAKA